MSIVKATITRDDGVVIRRYFKDFSSLASWMDNSGGKYIGFSSWLVDDENTDTSKWEYPVRAT